MRKINELFYSLQGEGYFTGTPSVFVRFSGCNLKCDFCDTHHDEGETMSDEAIVAAIKAFPATRVVLTGGEPSLFIDAAFIDLLHANGYFVQVETNGTRPLPANIDWVTCSPKQGGVLALNEANELKVVFTGQNLSVFDSFRAPHRFLQPCSNKNTNETIAYILTHPQWRLSLQTHRFVGIR